MAPEDAPIPYALTRQAEHLTGPVDPDPAGWHLARVRADVAAAKAGRTEDLLGQVLAQLEEIRAELAALLARETS